MDSFASLIKLSTHTDEASFVRRGVEHFQHLSKAWLHASPHLYKANCALSNYCEDSKCEDHLATTVVVNAASMNRMAVDDEPKSAVSANPKPPKTGSNNTLPLREDASHSSTATSNAVLINGQGSSSTATKSPNGVDTASTMSTSTATTQNAHRNTDDGTVNGNTTSALKRVPTNHAAAADEARRFLALLNDPSFDKSDVLIPAWKPIRDDTISVLKVYESAPEANKVVMRDAGTVIRRWFKQYDQYMAKKKNARASSSPPSSSHPQKSSDEAPSPNGKGSNKTCEDIASKKSTATTSVASVGKGAHGTTEDTAVSPVPNKKPTGPVQTPTQKPLLPSASAIVSNTKTTTVSNFFGPGSSSTTASQNTSLSSPSTSNSKKRSFDTMSNSAPVVENAASHSNNVNDGNSAEPQQKKRKLVTNSVTIAKKSSTRRSADMNEDGSDIDLADDNDFAEYYSSEGSDFESNEGDDDEAEENSRGIDEDDEEEEEDMEQEVDDDEDELHLDDE